MSQNNESDNQAKRWIELRERTAQNPGGPEARAATVLRQIHSTYRDCTTVSEFRLVTEILAGQIVPLASAIGSVSPQSGQVTKSAGGA